MVILQFLFISFNVDIEFILNKDNVNSLFAYQAVWC